MRFINIEIVFISRDIFGRPIFAKTGSVRKPCESTFLGNYFKRSAEPDAEAASVLLMKLISSLALTLVNSASDIIDTIAEISVTHDSAKPVMTSI